MPVRVRHLDDRLDTHDLDVLAVPKVPRERGVHFRPHPYDSTLVIREIWTGFGRCLGVSAFHTSAENHARIYGNALLEAYERDQIQRIG